jgi:hypothetical protein
MEKKIILFCKFSNDYTSGIGHVLGREGRRSFFAQHYLLSHLTEKLFLSQDKISNESSGYDWKILLVSDLMKQEEYSLFINQDCLVIYHTKPEGIGTWLKEKNFIGKQGQHEPVDGSGYILIKGLVEAYNETEGQFDATKFDEVYQKLVGFFIDEKLETDLNSLHDLYLDSNASDEDIIKLRNQLLGE